jgi:hypothetical protein
VIDSINPSSLPGRVLIPWERTNHSARRTSRRDNWGAARRRDRNHDGIEQYHHARVISRRSLSCAPYTTA